MRDAIDPLIKSVFVDDMMPSGIDTSESSDGSSFTITGNRIAGVDGSCYSGDGVPCDDTEACNGNSVYSQNISNNRPVFLTTN